MPWKNSLIINYWEIDTDPIKPKNKILVGNIIPQADIYVFQSFSTTQKN